MKNEISINELELAYKQVNTYIEFSQYASRERFRVLTTVSGLSAGLLVISTFGGNLLELTYFVKVLLTILLLLIPAGLLIHLYDLSTGESKSHKMILEITRKKLGDETADEIGEKIKSSPTGILTLILPLILSLIVITISILIWVQ